MTENNTGNETKTELGVNLESFLYALVIPIKNAKGMIMNKSQYKNY
jgi:hypothetical protein